VGQKDRVTGGFGELLDTGRDVDGVADQSNSSLPPPRFEARRRIARFVAGPDAPSRRELQRLWRDRWQAPFSSAGGGHPGAFDVQVRTVV